MQPLPVHGSEGVEAVIAGFNAAYTADNGYRVAHHGVDIVPPLRQFCLVLTENLANQTLECLRKRRIRDVSLVLIELT